MRLEDGRLMKHSLEPRRFEAFFQDPVYLLYKNHLYNYLARRFAIRRILKVRAPQEIVELGCGISPMMKGVRRAVRTDLSWRALAYLKENSRDRGPVRAVACEATRLPFQDGSIDCIICSEVLEHIPDDGKALEEMSRVLGPRGELVLTCPIHPEHFGFDDRFVGHYRRYDVENLVGQLSRMGFRDFRICPVLGPLEKQIMEPLTRLFSRLKTNENQPRSLHSGIRTLAWLSFPLYLIFNYFLALCVFVQAQLVPQKKVVTVCIRCQKAS